MRTKLMLLGLALVASAVVAEPARAESTFEVKDLRVEFLPDRRVRVRGKLRCLDLLPETSWRGERTADNEVDVNIDFPHEDRGFSLLPDEFRGLHSDPSTREGDLKEGETPYYVHEGKEYHDGQREAVIYNPLYLLRPSVFEKSLKPEVDDGRWLAFDKALDFRQVPVAKSLRYRVVVRWKKSYVAGCFYHDYFWAVYGPFAWGEAPPCGKLLRGMHEKPVSFTSKGVEVKERVGESDATESPSVEGGDDKEEKTRPKPERQDRRPTQLEAADASEKLGDTLAAWPEFETVAAVANPWVATVDLRLASNPAPGAMAALVARAAVEVAYGFPWVKSMNLTFRSEQTSTVEIPWAEAAKYAAGEVTLLEFHKTWKVTGLEIKAPPAQ